MKTKSIKNEKYAISILGFGWYTNTRGRKVDKQETILPSIKIQNVEPFSK